MKSHTDPTFDEQLQLELGKLNHATSVGLGEQVLKASFTLNGGGMIALPTILKVFGFDLRLQPSLAFPVSLAIILFASGLILTWIAAGLGYFANREAARS